MREGIHTLRWFNNRVGTTVKRTKKGEIPYTLEIQSLFQAKAMYLSQIEKYIDYEEVPKVTEKQIVNHKRREEQYKQLLAGQFTGCDGYFLTGKNGNYAQKY